MVNYHLEIRESKTVSDDSGTVVEFNIDNSAINKAFFEVGLPSDFEKRFSWFLLLYPNKNIYINGTPLSIDRMIGEKRKCL